MREQRTLVKLHEGFDRVVTLTGNNASLCEAGAVADLKPGDAEKLIANGYATKVSTLWGKKADAEP